MGASVGINIGSSVTAVLLDPREGYRSRVEREASVEGIGEALRELGREAAETNLVVQGAAIAVQPRVGDRDDPSGEILGELFGSESGAGGEGAVFGPKSEILDGLPSSGVFSEAEALLLAFGAFAPGLGFMVVAQSGGAIYSREGETLPGRLNPWPVEVLYRLLGLAETEREIFLLGGEERSSGGVRIRPSGEGGSITIGGESVRRGHVARAAVEAIAFGIRSSVGEKSAPLILAGPLSRFEALSRILADITGESVFSVAEGPAEAAARIALKGETAEPTVKHYLPTWAASQREEAWKAWAGEEAPGRD